MSKWEAVPTVVGGCGGSRSIHATRQPPFRQPGWSAELVQVRLEYPEVLVAHDPAVALLGVQERGGRPAQRHGPVSPRVTRPVRRRIPEWTLSITLVVPRHRRSAGVSPIPLTVNISPSPSRRLPAASGCCFSTQDANCSILALPSFAPSFQAARSTERAWSWSSLGRWPVTLRILWFRQRCTRQALPKTWPTALRSALEPSRTNSLALPGSRPRSTRLSSSPSATTAFSLAPSGGPGSACCPRRPHRAPRGRGGRRTGCRRRRRSDSPGRPVSAPPAP